MAETTYRLIGSDRVAILRDDGMSNEEMVRIAQQWELARTPVRVYNVIFENGHPMKAQYRYFIGERKEAQNRFFTGERKEALVEFMAAASLTHRVMFVEDSGAIFITESKDGNTNIDADLIEAFANALAD